MTRVLTGMVVMGALAAGVARAGTDEVVAVSAVLREVVAEHAPWAGPGTPGGIVGVVREGELVAVHAFGRADLSPGTVITPETAFYIASVAKTLTAFCAVHAALEGELDLDASLREHFPGFSANHARISLRQAMHHTSGLLDPYDVAIVADLPLNQLATNADAIELLGRIHHVAFPPGTRFMYSNSGYVLLAEALARSTGQSLAEYAREHAFEPFGMRQAHFTGEEWGGPVAEGHVYTGGRWRAEPVRTGLHGPGGVRASLADLVAFDRALRDQVEGELYDALFTPGDGAQHAVLGRYAAGWMLQEIGGLPVQRHLGGAFGSGGDLLRFPEQDLSVIVLTNTSRLAPQRLSVAVARRLLADEMGPEARPEGTATASRFGRFWIEPEAGVVWVLSPRGRGFLAASLADWKLELAPVGARRLEAPGAQVPLAMELDGDELVVEGVARTPLRLTPVAFAPATPQEIEALAGRYHHRLLEAEIELRADGSSLTLVQHDPIIELPPFQSLNADLFVCDRGAQIMFDRDGNGAVEGLTLSGNRAWRLRFERVD